MWPGSALALWRPQLVSGLLVVSVLALLAGRRGLVLGGLAVALLGSAFLVPALRAPGPAAPETRTVKILSLNLWHRNDDVAAVRALLEREQPDVVALLELTPTWARALAPALRGYPARAYETAPGSTGIGVYARAHLDGPEVVRLGPGTRAAVVARLDLLRGPAWLLVVHPPGSLTRTDAEAHQRELSAIGDWAREHGARTVVCGDFNATPWARSVRGALERGELRAALPGGFLGGSWPGVPRPLRVPIDGCLVGREVRARADFGPGVGSDHLPVVVEVA